MEIMGIVAFVMVIPAMTVAATGCVCLMARLDHLESKLRDSGALSD